MRIAARRADQIGAETFLVVEEDLEEVLGRWWPLRNAKP